eukprot:1772489-Pleurochrysis_carterae.AAC.2
MEASDAISANERNELNCELLGHLLKVKVVGLALVIGLFVVLAADVADVPRRRNLCVRGGLQLLCEVDGLVRVDQLVRRFVSGRGGCRSST